MWCWGGGGNSFPFKKFDGKQNHMKIVWGGNRVKKKKGASNSGIGDVDMLEGRGRDSVEKERMM